MSERRCQICGAVLSCYNPKDVCYYHPEWMKMPKSRQAQKRKRGNKFSPESIFHGGEASIAGGGIWRKSIPGCP